MKNLSLSIKINFFIIITFYIFALLADILAPYTPFESNSKRIAYSPPIHIRFNFKDKFYFKRFELKINHDELERDFIESKQKCHINLFKLDNKIRLLYSPDCPKEMNFFGTDRLGRDYFSRLLYGLRPSLFSAILGIIISFPFGVILGTISGYFKGLTDRILMRIVELILSFPSFYMLIILAGLLPPKISNFDRLMLITMILSFIGWAGLARIVRGQVLSISEREFVKSAELAAVPKWKIIIREIIPQLSTYLIINLMLSFPVYILGETALSFLGLGINQPDPSLGNLLAEGRDINNLFLRPYLGIIPILILILITAACNNLSDAFRNIFDIKAN